MAKVSVIIPTYNNENDVIKCINSILEQSFVDFEIIIVDDDSQDQTYNQIKIRFGNHPQVKIFKNDSNKKAAYTRNRAIEESRGKYIAVQDADDYSHILRLEKQVRFLEENPKYQFVGSNTISIDNGVIWKKTHFKKEPLLQDFMIGGFPFIHGSIMFRKETLTEVGGYRVAKETERGQDSDLLLRLYLNGYKGYNLKDYLYYYEENLDTVKKRNFKQRYNAVKSKMKYFPWKKLSFIEKIKIIRTLIVGLVPSTLWYKFMKIRARKSLK